MLDVPILYKGELLGVICIESLTDRVWDKLDVDFAQLLSSLYTFSYSVNESNKLSSIVLNKETQLTNRMDAINRSNAVIEFDLDGVIKFANDSFLKTMGYSSDEIIGKHHSVFVFEDEKNSEEYDNFWKLLKTGEYFLGNVVRKKKDGSPIYLQSTYNPIIGDDGKPYRVMKIATDVTESYDQKMEIDKKNTYLEHAAKILRHDMHSGINTYIPRGVSSLERRLTPEIIESAKLEAPLKMIKEGLKHTQKVYKGVYEFTNLVKTDVVLSKTECSIQKIMDDYLSATAYKSQVHLDDNLPTIEVNESLMCTSIDNLIRNGLKYNDSKSKLVKIYSEGDYICIEDNGRGIDQKDFDELSKPYVRKEGQKETGSGLGLNICKAILKEHGFDITAEKLEQGTKLRIKIK
jgi:PAS domain S-box-containing protein